MHSEHLELSRMPQWQGSKVQVEHLQFVSINESIIFYKKIEQWALKLFESRTHWDIMSETLWFL